MIQKMQRLRLWLYTLHNKGRALKIILSTALIFVFVVVAIKAGCNYLVVSNADGRLYSDAASAPQAETGLLLGTTP